MSYLCQDCKSNNNGWCIVRKCNGLKKLNITNCNTYEDKNVVEFIGDEKDNNSESYRVLGKRQMLWNIQKQIVAINESDESYEEKYKGLVDCIKSFGIHLNFEEDLWGVNSIVDSMIDDDMIKESKYINDNLL